MPSRPAPRPRRAAGADRRRGAPPARRPRDTRGAVFAAAAEAFSARGFDGVRVDDIADAAGVNKAMIYYHFADKLALYRGVVAEMLTAARERLAGIAASGDPPDQKVRAFVGSFAEFTRERPWGPPLMLREIAEGAPHLDRDTLALMRDVFLTFGRILADGQRRGVFRPVNPVLAYMSTVAPLLLNAARERAAAQPGRRDLPMFVEVPRGELVAHMQNATLRILCKD